MSGAEIGRPWYDAAMLATLLTILFGVADVDADAFRTTAPRHLTLESAREHLWAATVAALAFDEDRDVLLSIAHHESNYEHQAVTVEPEIGTGRRVSCGVMTPEPIASCPRGMTVLSGYLAGARHLRAWLDAYRGNLHAALLGYAGGGEHGLVGACRRGPVIIRPGVDACGTARVFLWRAALIRRALARVHSKRTTS